MSKLEAKIKKELSQGLYKSPGVYLLLDIGKTIHLYVIKKQKKSDIQKINLDKFVVDFVEAVSIPNKPRHLKDFCTDYFFIRKTGLNAKEAYEQTQDGSVDGAEAFVEFGANMGALLANLDVLYQPKLITITGALSDYFSAWSHAMGKMRNQYKGSKKHCPVQTL